MKKSVAGLFVVFLVTPLAGDSGLACLSPDIIQEQNNQAGQEITVPQRRRRHLRREVRRRRGRRSIRRAFRRAGTSAGHGGKRFGQNMARGRPLRGGKEFGKGMGGFGKHTGRGMARIGRRVAKP